MKKATRLLSLLLIFAMLFSIGACSTSGSNPSNKPADSSASPATGTPETQTAAPAASGEQPKYGGTVTIGWRNLPPDLFFINNYSLSSYFLAPVCESLARKTGHENTWEPFLADSMTSDLSNNTLTIKLKEGIKFHDGSELTAEVVKWNFQYMVDHKQGASIGNPTSFDVTDKYTLVVHFAQPSVNWIILLGQVPLYSQLAFETNGLDYCKLHPVGTGPFVFKEIVADDHISYLKNTNYWQEGLPYLDGWNIQVVADAAAQMTALTNKEIDFMEVGDAPTIDTLVAMGFKDQHESDPNGYTAYTIYPNSKVEGDPWYKTEVRQAVLLYGIDWDAVAKLSSGNRGYKSLQLGVKDSLCYVDGLEEKANYDLEKAKTMLAEAGYPDGFSTKIFSPVTTIAAATAVQDQLKKLNINAEVVKVTVQDTQRMDGVTPGLSMIMLTSAYDIVYKVFSAFFNKDSANYGKNILYSDAFNEAYAKALTAATWEERAENGKTCAQLLNFDECKLRVMYMTSNAYFIQDYFRGSNYNVGIELFTITPEKAWLNK